MPVHLIFSRAEVAALRDRIRRAIAAPDTEEGQQAARELLGLARELDAATGSPVQPHSAHIDVAVGASPLSQEAMN